MGNYVRAAALNGFEELVASYKINPSTILDSVGISVCLSREPDALIDYNQYLNLLEITATLCKEECFGLKLGCYQSVRTLGLIGIYMSRQKTVLDSLNIAQKYIYAHAEGFVFDVNLLPNRLCELVVVSQSLNNPVKPQKAQLSICSICNILKDLTNATWRPEKIKLKQNPSLKSQRLLRETLGCPIEFNADKDALYFSTAFLVYKPHYYDDDLINQLIVQQIEGQKTKSKDSDTFLIESSIKMLLATGECSITNIALCVGQHPKKMQRQLQDKGTSYRDLLENVRKKEAIRMIETNPISLTDTALQLGYAELSIFSRQFKSWFGMTPTEWKNKA